MRVTLHLDGVVQAPFPSVGSCGVSLPLPRLNEAVGTARHPSPPDSVCACGGALMNPPPLSVYSSIRSGCFPRFFFGARAFWTRASPSKTPIVFYSPDCLLFGLG